MFKDLCREDNSLRPYQQEAKEKIFLAWDECDNIMFQMPTGTGKTRLFTSIISDVKSWSILNANNSKILIIAHRIELIDQISANLQKYKISHGIIAGGKERNLRPQVQIASIQTITHRTNFDVVRDLNVRFIIIDEAHHSLANSYKKLWTLYPNAKKLGVTATPWRMSNIGFTSIYENLIISKPIKSFIEEGWLAPYSYYSINSSSLIKEEIRNIDEFDIEGDYKISALEKVMDKGCIRAHLLDSYLNLAKGKKGIIYSISRKHSDHICEEYKAAGVNIVRIDSKTSKNERTLYVQRFKEGLIDVIVNVDIFSEGFDCPDIEFIQLARPTRSLAKYLQQVGRGLRPIKGKGKCIILDNVGAHLEFGLPDSNRDWYESFIGEEKCKKVRITNVIESATKATPEHSLIEGTDKMELIEDVPFCKENENINNSSTEWTDADKELLKALYLEKKCSPEIISLVFHKNESEIIRLIKDLE